MVSETTFKDYLFLRNKEGVGRRAMDNGGDFGDVKYLAQLEEKEDDAGILLLLYPSEPTVPVSHHQAVVYLAGLAPSARPSIWVAIQ